MWNLATVDEREVTGLTTLTSQPGKRQPGKRQNKTSIALPGEAVISCTVSPARLPEWGIPAPSGLCAFDKVPGPSVPQTPHWQSENMNSMFQVLWG